MVAEKDRRAGEDPAYLEQEPLYERHQVGDEAC